jgi:hypothetical protein
MPTICVAMLELDNRDTFQGMNNKSFDAFDDAVQRADALFNAHAPANAIRIFMAPEYSFSDHQVTAVGSVNIGSFSSSDKMGLYKKLQATSSQYSDIVIVAGTIAYKKGLVSKSHLAVCPILWNGQFLLKYYKQSFDGFQIGASDKTFDRKNNGSTFTHQGVTFGIEVCSDHGLHKTLRNAIGPHASVDVHLLVSEGMAPTPMAICTKPGGLMVNCDMSGRKNSGNGIRTVGTNKFNNPSVDMKATGHLTESTGLALGSGAHVVLYSGSF